MSKQKQLKLFHREIQTHHLILMTVFFLMVLVVFCFSHYYWSKKLILAQSQHVISILHSSTYPHLTKSAIGQLKKLPYLDLLTFYHPKKKKYTSWKQAEIKTSHLQAATHFFDNYRLHTKLEPVKQKRTNKQLFFLFSKPPGHYGRVRLIKNNLILQFDLTSLYRLTALPFLFIFLGLSVLMTVLMFIKIESIYHAMSRAIGDFEGLLKEIFIGNFNVQFSAREFTFTQRIANVMNQMLFFYNEHVKQKDKVSNHDQLTGLVTRRHFNTVFENEVKRATRYQHPLSFLLIDIDHFKKFNDQYGHLMGDKVLAQSAQLIAKQVRDSDVVARYGGEEIGVILVETDFEGALKVAEKLRFIIAESNYTYQGHTVNVTISVGVSTLSHQQSELYLEMIKRADAGLYQAKNDGRNRVGYIEPA